MVFIQDISRMVIKEKRGVSKIIGKMENGKWIEWFENGDIKSEETFQENESD